MQSIFSWLCGVCKALPHIAVPAGHLCLCWRIPRVKQCHCPQFHRPHSACPGNAPDSRYFIGGLDLYFYVLMPCLNKPGQWIEQPRVFVCQVTVLHIAAYYFGYRLARSTIAKESIPLARCISLETGMQVREQLDSDGKILCVPIDCAVWLCCLQSW